MATNSVTVSGMFGNNKTYFADSPVIIDISNLEWPGNSPFNIVRVEVIYDGHTVGDFRIDTKGEGSISLDISLALQAIWADYRYDNEIAAAAAAAGNTMLRGYRSYSLVIHTEYISIDGVFTETTSSVIAGGRCAIGRLTEWERSGIQRKEDADMSSLNGTNTRNGDASTKPTSSPERVGSTSITSWTDVDGNGTRMAFFGAAAQQGEDSPSAHAPVVIRDDIPYTDFLFVNRRGAVETCSAQMLEAMDINVETTGYSLVERPAFKPSRSVFSISSGGRRSWSMSSGYQTRDWATWWTMEFLKARRWWMLVSGRYVPVIVEPAKKQTTIYDRSKQQMPSVEFTVTMALEG